MVDARIEVFTPPARKCLRPDGCIIATSARWRRRRSSHFPLTPYSTAKPGSLGFANLRKSEVELSMSYCFISLREWRWDLYLYQRCRSWLCGKPWETEAVRN